jgi:hypothetical protein
MNASPLRYFLVIGLHPRHNLAVLVAVTVVGLWTVTMSSGELDSALGMLLFVQMFLASTGFLIRARRGHFDPLLTATYGRLIVCVAHWFVSALPVAIAWALVTGVDVAYGGSAAPAFAGRRLMALLIVSSMAWIAGFGLTRGAAGALWTAGLVAALLHRSDLLGAASTAPVSSLVSIVRQTAAVIVCPFLLLGPRPPLAPGSIAAAGSTAALALLSAWRLSNHVDVYLRDRT